MVLLPASDSSGKVMLACLAEFGEDVDGIVTDAYQLHTGSFNLLQIGLQLN